MKIVIKNGIVMTRDADYYWDDDGELRWLEEPVDGSKVSVIELKGSREDFIFQASRLKDAVG